MACRDFTDRLRGGGALHQYPPDLQPHRSGDLRPLVFGLSVFDGFQYTLNNWLARYLNVFLWLPVANIFGAIIGKVQENMLKLDISQVQNAGDTFFSATDTAYLIFLIIGIVGYFTVPAVAGYI